MKRWTPLLRELGINAGLLLLATGFCFGLRLAGVDTGEPAALIYLLCIVLAAYCTRGYLFGVAACALSAVLVNTLFTYPFGEFNLTLAGYPLTFGVMLAVSLLISMLTTQIRRQEKMRYEAEKQKMLFNLLRAVSHDIRTPLTAISGASAYLSENPELPTGERQEICRDIVRDTEWLLRLSENVLSITRYSGENPVALRKEEEILEEVVSGAVRRFERNCPTIPVTIERPDEILLVPMDATLMEQVLLNLFQNAVDHGKTTGRIAVRITPAPERGRVTVSVADDGCGFPPDKLSHAFDGIRASSAPGEDVDRHHRNMGIGLAVCETIIAAHGGEISAKNGAAGGAEVTLSLPYTPCDLKGYMDEQ